MKLIEALNKAKYPEDRIIDDSNSTDPYILYFNEGWNNLRSQLIEISKEEK